MKHFFQGVAIGSMLVTSLVVLNNYRHVNAGSVEENKMTFIAEASAYCPCVKCCGVYSDGMTANGSDANQPGVAVDPSIFPYGSILDIDGIGSFKADDTGSSVRKKDGKIRIEIRFKNHEDAVQFGRRMVEFTLR